jgi:dGTP triphosphohydrolase
MANPTLVPDVDTTFPLPLRARLVCDFISGMTDTFAEKQFQLVKDRLCRMPKLTNE